jgi:hypothetical protein
MVAGLLIFRSEPNARYLYAALPLMLIPPACLLGSLTPGRLRNSILCFAALCVPLNAYFLTASDQYHHDFYVASPLSKSGREKYIRKAAPVRQAIAYFERAHPGAPVLLAQGGNITGLTGDVIAAGWHDYMVWNRVLAATDAADLAHLLAGWRVRYIIALKPAFGPKVEPASLAELLRRCGTPEFEAGGAYVARLAESCPAAATR